MKLCSPIVSSSLRMKRIFTSVTRLKHEWRLSTMFPAPQAAPVGHGAPAAVELEDQGQGAVEAGSISQKLMISKSLMQGAAPGTFYILPFATRAIEKLYRMIDHEMNAIGGQKIATPCLSSAQPWQHSGRWDLMGSELFTLQDRKDGDYCLAPTHEEAVASVVAADGPISYKRLPIMLYQIGRKFRDEMRPKSGLLRCREFEMKDLYSFDEDEVASRKSYEKVCTSYTKLFERLQLNCVKVEADTGSMGGNLSHEFQLLADVGEDTIFSCQQCGKRFNMELLDADNRSVRTCSVPDCGPDFKEETSIEVAQAFLLGTRYSEQFNALFVDRNQRKKPLYMGCYGVGVTRLLAAALEVSSLSEEVRWPRLLAPHQIIIIPQKEGYKSDVSLSLCESLYASLSELPALVAGEVVLDDRLSMSIGKRLQQAKQMGYPLVIIAGKQSLDDPPKFEVVDVYSGEVEYLTVENLLRKASNIETILLW